MSTDYYKPSAWTGWIVFAAAVILTVGAIDIIQGIVALTKDSTYLIPEKVFWSRPTSPRGGGR